MHRHHAATAYLHAVIDNHSATADSGMTFPYRSFLFCSGWKRWQMHNERPAQILQSPASSITITREKAKAAITPTLAFKNRPKGLFELQQFLNLVQSHLEFLDLCIRRRNPSIG